LETICPEGHNWNVTWNNFERGRRCRRCSDIKKGDKRRKDLSFIKGEFNKEGYILLSTKCNIFTKKYDYQCPVGHLGSISWNGWYSGRRCFKCNANIKKDINQIKESFEKEGYRLLTNTYGHYNGKLYFVCPRKHKHYISWSNWVQGHRCGKCGNEDRIKYFSKEELNNFLNYKKNVISLSNRSFYEFYYFINPKNLDRGGNFHLDHIYSIADGYENNLDIKIISHPINLQIVDSKINLTKWRRSDFTLDELHKKIKEFDKNKQKFEKKPC